MASASGFRDKVLGIQVAHHINALHDIVKSSEPPKNAPPCHNDNHWECHAVAAVKCLDCNVYYCRGCKFAHKLAAVAKGHETIPLSELTPRHIEKAFQKQMVNCHKHTNSPVYYFCKECQIPLCQRCSTTNHRIHSIVDLEKVSGEYRARNNQIIQEDFKHSKQALEKTREETEKEMARIDKEYDKNKREIHKHYEAMMSKLLEQNQRLDFEMRRSKSERIRGHQRNIEEINAKLGSLSTAKDRIENMTNFSPDNVLVAQQEELQHQATEALQEATSPELWIHTTEVTSTGECAVDMALKLEERSQKTIICLESITGIVQHQNILIAWNWNHADEPTDFFVQGNNKRDSKFLKNSLEKFCPQVFRIVPIRKHDREVLAIFEATNRVWKEISILDFRKDECKTIYLHEPDDVKICTLTVDRNNDIIYACMGAQVAIKKWTRDGCKTIFENKGGYQYLECPEHLCVNIDGNIIVADSGNGHLLIFNKRGVLLNIHNNFSDPSGVCTDENGNIYVCDYRGHDVHRLDQNGEFIEIFVTQYEGVKHPTAVVCDSGLLLVGQFSGEVKYFKL